MIDEALSAHGLIARGGFNFEGAEPAPPGPSAMPARAVVLVGQAGASAWPHFVAWRQRQPNALPDPLDTWSREVIGAVAARLGARAVSPSDRPHAPFQRWAMRAEGLRASPLGILMHPQYGLWHAYRGALLFDAAIDTAPATAVIHPCDTCVAKPCLKSCPVGAYSDAGFDHAACLAHVRAEAGRPCMRHGCLDRNACPYGASYRYPADMQAFHMASFAT
ncbi:hypothetical protein [Denitromonas iodatirespirans]|uniref:4Fe-4S dicluster domain-containing protein n=1 Tax=Denitromonas iodatirespirans TaxID=2795389 RepID=A0A944D847_DENI1|nr:hypothetical protein [Denitromonas iodatirespirans]MBT0961580.1 hypothetical protein [Denitromonas iodatirespirans]